MNGTPQGERVRIVFAGRCNAGKSSLLNAIAGQPVAIVSGERGTTTDPVRKAMELLPIGPVLLCDTAGLDDETGLGAARLEKTRAELRQADLVLLVVDGRNADGALCDAEAETLAECRRQGIPAITVLNKCDEVAQGRVGDAQGREGLAPSCGAVQGRGGLAPSCGAVQGREGLAPSCGVVQGRGGLAPSFGAVQGRPSNLQRPPRGVAVSALTGAGIPELKQAMVEALRDKPQGRRLVADLVAAGDIVALVVPIDSAAPKGRLILPQQQAIRDLLDAGAIPLVTRDSELGAALAALARPPALVITDSQAFGRVAGTIPRGMPLTSFSILFARYKGDLRELVAGARAVAALKDGDRILVAEGCTHHRQEDDIGTVKIPRLLEKKTGRKLVFEHSSGVGYPDDLADFALVVHCGACMLNRREMLSRIGAARAAGVPIVNYGVLLALLNGILDRALEPIVAHSDETQCGGPTP